MDAAAFSPSAPELRVDRSFAFIDLSGFTDFVDAYGDVEAVGELRLLRNAVRDIAPLCGVRVDKWLGDGAMLVGIEIEPVVAAVIAIGARFSGEGQLQLRAGIARGPVILLEGDDYIGRAVNLAARLCDNAEPGQVLAAVDGLTLPAGVEIADRRSVAIRGMASEVAVLELAPQERRSPTSALRSLVGDLTRPLRSLRP